MGCEHPHGQQRWDVDNGRIPFVNWNAGTGGSSIVRWSAIANGSQDAWIRERADAFKAFGSPIYLTFHHEPEDDLSRFGTAADFAAAFRRIVTVFRSRSVTNVAFVWTMMAWSFNPKSGRSAMSYYPGDSYIDIVGGDGYSWYPTRAGDVWTSFLDIFTDVNAFALAHGKPWMVVEYGCLEDPAVPGRKAQWFRDALTTAKSWPALKALIYFDVFKSPYRWETDTTSSSMSGYRQIALDPYLSPPTSERPLVATSPSPPRPLTPRLRAPALPASATLRNDLDTAPRDAAIGTSTSSGDPFGEVVTTKRAHADLRPHTCHRRVLGETHASRRRRLLLRMGWNTIALVRTGIRVAELVATIEPPARAREVGSGSSLRLGGHAATARCAGWTRGMATILSTTAAMARQIVGRDRSGRSTTPPGP